MRLPQQEDRVELRIEMYRNDPPRMIIRKKSEEAHEIFGIEAEDIYDILIGRTGLYQMLECDNCPLKTTRGE